VFAARIDCDVSAVGLVIQPDEVALFKSKGHLLHMREVFRSLPTAFVDVSIKMQQIADDGAFVSLCMQRSALMHAAFCPYSVLS